MQVRKIVFWMNMPNGKKSAKIMQKKSKKIIKKDFNKFET